MRTSAGLPAVLLATALASAPPALTLRVVDPSGSAISNAVLSVQGPTPHQPPTEHPCTARGICTVNRLTPGPHTLTIRAAGFPIEQLSNVEITAGRPMDLGAIVLKIRGCEDPRVICDSISPGDPIFRKGTLEIPVLCAADFDQGNSHCTVELDGRGTIPAHREPNDDLYLRPARRNTVDLIPRNRAALALLPRAPWSPQTCAEAALSDKPITIDPTRPFLIDPSSPGPVFCLRTNEGRFTQFVLLPPRPDKPDFLRLSYITWQ